MIRTRPRMNAASRGRECVRLEIQWDKPPKVLTECLVTDSRRRCDSIDVVHGTEFPAGPNVNEWPRWRPGVGDTSWFGSWGDMPFESITKRPPCQVSILSLRRPQNK